MTGVILLVDWAIRGAALAAVCAAMLWALRVRDVSARLAAWVAVLAATLSLPLLMTVVPAMLPSAPAAGSGGFQPVARLNLIPWLYAAVAAAFLCRLATGSILARRLVRRSRAIAGERVRESDTLQVPVTVGVVKPVILLPRGWREWDETTRRAVLAHEQSHLARHDTRVQFFSALHRALLWFSPVSWWLHSELARLAEEASDDRALSTAVDRTGYAEILLGFLSRAPRRAMWSGVAMARTPRAEQRIERILSGHIPSAGLRARTLVAIAAVAIPLACAAAAARLADPQPPQAPAAPRAAKPPRAPQPAPPAPRPQKPSPVVAPEPPAPPPPPDAVISGVIEGSIEDSVAELNRHVAELGRIDASELQRLAQEADQLTRESDLILKDAAERLRDAEASLREALKAIPSQVELERLRRTLEEVSRKLSSDSRKK